ncbi:MAG TPA: hypothetical protein VJ771_07820 [Candidatus Nitrosotalea sp.]|nr:hypothetical protein [Candidatus Nitrosotalea sp.]
MIEVDVMLKVNTTFEKVWNIISDVDNDHKYWKEIVQIKNTSRGRNVVVREIYMSNGSKYHQKITLFPKEGIHIRWTKGTITGIKDIMLIDSGNTTVIRVQISYKPRGAVRIGSRDILEELQSETENALEMIKKEAERNPYDTIKNKT